MTRFNAGDIVRVLFPHVDSDVRRYRPAVVVSDGCIGPDGLLIWAAMITSARRPSWPGDVMIDDHAASRLPIPSKVRTSKIATLEAGSTERIGRLIRDALAAVQQETFKNVGLSG